MRTDPGGAALWSEEYDHQERGHAEGVAALDDGGLVIVGSTASNGGPADLWMVRADAAGVDQWDRTHGDDAHDGGFDVATLPNGDLALVGTTASEGAKDVWDLRTTPDGTLVCP